VALDEGRFEPRNVVLGVEAEGGMIQVLSGLQSGDRIVSSGQFLLDSESQLREAIDKMRGSTPDKAGVTEPGATNGTVAVAASAAEPETTVYVCPMPEHVSIVYDHPGNCPICGMALVPVTPSELKKIQPGGKVLYYTCPMPEHASVHQDSPGKCPLCGMTLVPVMSQPELASPTNAPAAGKYVCPMDPDVVSDHPGQCPKCGMTLVPVSP
jgi:ribosomal protein S27E